MKSAAVASISVGNQVFYFHDSKKLLDPREKFLGKVVKEKGLAVRRARRIARRIAKQERPHSGYTIVVNQRTGRVYGFGRYSHVVRVTSADVEFTRDSVYVVCSRDNIEVASGSLGS